MKVLLLGATGNLGSRILPALLTHGHSVVAYVRSSKKLESLLPASVYQQITTVEGNARDSQAIKSAILSNKCDAIVSAAGLAAMAPWGKSDLPEIFGAILEGTRAAGEERGKPLRAWFLGGTGVLNYPGTETMISNYIPVYLTHRRTIALLQALPPNAVDWSMLCPADMKAESSDLSVPTKPSMHGKLIAQAGSPPNWQDSWMKWIPLLGRSIVAGMNFPRYETTLEQNAELIAEDLESAESRFSCRAVGIISASK